MLVTPTMANEEDENEDKSEDDPEDHEENEPEDEESKDYVLVKTVQGNCKGFTNHNIKMAQEARRLQGMIGNPTKQEFAGLMCEKLIAKCPITVRNVQNANQILALILQI
jgi:hypothetical protein